ncbi:MAG: hypothetical protein ACK52I_27310 [Pseudomonadota bacterium]
MIDRSAAGLVRAAQQPANTGSCAATADATTLEHDGIQRSRRARNVRSTTASITSPTTTEPTRYTGIAMSWPQRGSTN